MQAYASPLKDREKQQPVLEGLYENMCPIELKWMIQIVLKRNYSTSFCFTGLNGQR